MIMDKTNIVEKLYEKVENGSLKIEDVSVIYRDDVQKMIDAKKEGGN
jgi:hypothetical protein